MATNHLRSLGAWYTSALLVSLSLILGTIPVSAQETGVATIAQYSLYSSLRQCAQNCVWYQAAGDGILVDGTPDLVDVLDCGDPALNNCVCRSDLMVTASSFLTSCVSKECSNTNDITSAVAAYSSYCVQAANPPATSTTSGKRSFEDIFFRGMKANIPIS